MEVEHVEAGHPVVIDIAAHTFHFLVAARAEGLVACAGEDDDPYVGSFAAMGHGVEHLKVGLGTEGVVDLRAIDSNLGYFSMLLEQNIFIFFDSFPFSHCCGGIMLISLIVSDIVL